MLAERGTAMESYDFIAMNNEYVFNTYRSNSGDVGRRRRM